MTPPATCTRYVGVLFPLAPWHLRCWSSCATSTCFEISGEHQHRCLCISSPTWGRALSAGSTRALPLTSTYCNSLPLQVSYSQPGDIDLGIRFLQYELVAAPGEPGGRAVQVQCPLIVPQLSMRGGHAQLAATQSSLLPPASSPAVRCSPLQAVRSTYV